MMRASGALVGVCRRLASTSSAQVPSRISEKGATCEKEPSRPQSHYDVVVVGGGMVGNALAASIASAPELSRLSVRVLEAGPLPTNAKGQGEWSNRVSSVSPASKRLFERLGVWAELAERANPVLQIQVWDGCSSSRVTYEAGSEAEPISWLVENDAIVQALLRRLSDAPNVTLSYLDKISQLRLPFTSTEAPTVGLESGEAVAAGLLVGADGARSSVRAALGCRTFAWEYGQRGIVATLKISERGPGAGRNGVAWQRFLSSGPVAVLPLAPGVSSLVWCADDALAAELMGLDEASFVRRLNEALLSEGGQSGLANGLLFHAARLRHFFQPGHHQDADQPQVPLVTSASSRASFPLGLCHSSRYVGPKTALIGDAAHRLHPLAGMGVNLGFGDVEELTRQLAKGTKAGATVGDALYLENYERRRQVANVPVVGACEALSRLYGTSWGPVVAARSLGLAAVDASRPLKRLIMNLASN